MTDYTLEDTVFLPFTTRAFVTGIPTVLAGTPAIDIYEDATATPIITGETLVVSLNSVVGYNMITVTATAATGFNAGGHYTANVQAGTVGGVSVVGEVVGEFTLAASAAAVDLANATDGLTALAADIATAQADLDIITGAAGALLDTTAVDDIWDEVLTGATHNVTNSSGKRLRAIAGTIFREGTAQAGTSNTITLDAGASAIDNFFNNMSIFTVEGTGAQQQRIIIDYDGTTKVATISPQWVTTPDVTTEFEIVPGITHAAGTNLDLLVGHAVSSTATTIDLNGDASAIDGFYDMQLISIHDGTGAGQARSITTYNGTTKVATINRAWDTNPDTTSEYVITATIGEDVVADAIWDETLSGHVAAGSTGKGLTDAATILTTQMTESYAANGVAPTLAQAQFAIHQMLMQFGIAGTSLTVRKLDDSTTAFIVTLDDAVNPTDAKRI